MLVKLFNIMKMEEIRYFFLKLILILNKNETLFLSFFLFWKKREDMEPFYNINQN